MEMPSTYESKSAKLVYRIRRGVEHTPTRFQLARIAEHARIADWEIMRQAERARTLAAAKAKAAATRERNKDPFGLLAVRELMKSAEVL